MQFDLLGMIDVQSVQKLQDTFASITRTMAYIVDSSDEILTQESKLQGICRLADGIHECKKDCFEKNVKPLCEKCKKTGKAELGSCPISGLPIAAVPLMINDNYLGSWIIGQIRYEDPSLESITKLGVSLGKRPDAAFRLLYDIPQIPVGKYEEIFEFLQEMTIKLVNLDLSRTAFRRFVDSSSAAMYVVDYDTGNILMANKEYSRMVGKPIKKIIGMKCWETVDTRKTQRCTQCPREKLTVEDNTPGEIYHTRTYNEAFKQWHSRTDQAIEWVDGRLAHVVTIMDVTKEYEMERGLYKLAYFDRLLDLPNGIKLIRDLEERREQGNDPKLIFFNIAAMKQLNDVYGRESGDELLRQVASWLKKQPVHGSNIYRVDGDEFCIVLDNVSSKEAEAVASGIFKRFSEPWALEEESKSPSYYSGVSIFVISEISGVMISEIFDLVRRMLDISRYEGRVVVYDIEMDSAAKKQARLAVELKNCVKNRMQGFEVHYQPIIELASGNWKAVEALCRWTSPSSGRIKTEIFIREAERKGMINLIGEWVLSTAVSQCKDLGLDRHDDFFLSVNISPIQLMDKRFVSMVERILKKNGYPGEKLTLEVTESSEFVFNDYTSGMIERLSELGVRMALDDFGTGYSSYNSLRSLPVSFLKTEREFISGIEQDRYLQYFYYAVSELTHANGMKMIAEGIETKEQLEITRKNGADYFQGFLFAKPMPIHELARKLIHFETVHPDLGARIFKWKEPENWESESAVVQSLDNMNTVNVAIAPESCEILWVDKFTEQKYCDGESIIGQKCYEAIFGRKNVCPTCPMRAVMGGKDDNGPTVEFYNEYWKRQFITFGRKLPWPGRNPVYLESSLDVSDLQEHWVDDLDMDILKALRDEENQDSEADE